MTTGRQELPEKAPCPNCGQPVRPRNDWWCTNPACGAPLFFQPGELPDEKLAGTMRWSTRPDRPNTAGGDESDTTASDAGDTPNNTGTPPDTTDAGAAPGTAPKGTAAENAAPAGAVRPIPADVHANEPPIERLLQRLRPPTIACWNCGEPNSVNRVACYNCGKLLRRSRSATAVLAAFPWLSERYVTRETLIGALLAAILLIFGLLSLNALVDDGPVQQPTTVTPAGGGTQPQAQAPAALPVASASATSVWNQNQEFGAQAVLDNNLSTAWVSARGLPVGESLTLTLPRSAVITEIGIANGYQRPGRFSANGRAARVLISFDDGSGEERTLQDREGVQTLQLSRRTPRPTRTVLIQVLGVQPPQSSNVAISSVILRGRTS